MSNTNGDETNRLSETSRPGLTKPLINNIGGMIDQDAPSADQLLAHSPDGTWSKATVVQGSAGTRDYSGDDDKSIIPGFDRQ